jgi:hypothetical protein
MTTKYIKNQSGALTEAVTVSISAGAGDADKIPSLNASGFLDPTILNGVVSSAGAADAAKIPGLDGSGRLDPTVMPVGVVADTKSIAASENLSAGDFVNLHSSSGLKVRRADASNGRRAHGFVLSGVLSGANALVYFEGANTQVSGRTVAATQFLSGSTPGAATETAPSTSGYLLQEIGVADATTEINFLPRQPITLA